MILNIFKFYFYRIWFSIRFTFNYSSKCSISQYLSYFIFMSDFLSFLVTIVTGISSFFCRSWCNNFYWFVGLIIFGRVRGIGWRFWTWAWAWLAWITSSSAVFFMLIASITIFLMMISWLSIISRSRAIFITFIVMFSLSRLSKITFGWIYSEIDF